MQNYNQKFKGKNPKAVIFDMDGVLIDSMPIWDQTWKEFVRKRGSVDVANLRKKVAGAGHREAIEIYKQEAGVVGNTEELVKEIREIFFAQFLDHPKVMPFAVDFLKRISGKYILAIATGLGPRENVLRILQAIGMSQYFSYTVTGDEIVNGKPNPDIYLTTARKIGVDPADCLVIEDSLNGVQAGKAAGMMVYGINNESDTREKLKEAHADKIFASFEEVTL